MSEFDLAGYVAASKQDLTRTVEIRPGAEITIRYLSREEWRRVTRSVEKIRNPAARDAALEGRLRDLLASAVVGWRGLSPQVVAELIPVDPGGLPAELPFSRENVRELLEHSVEFSTLLLDEITNLAAFRASALEAEQKN
jgi:hypothetical protein